MTENNKIRFGMLINWSGDFFLFSIKWSLWIVSVVSNIFGEKTSPFGFVFQGLFFLIGTFFLGLSSWGFWIRGWSWQVLPMGFAIYLVVGFILAQLLDAMGYEFEHLNFKKEIWLPLRRALSWPWKNIDDFPDFGLSPLCVGCLIIICLIGFFELFLISLCLLGQAWLFASFLLVVYLGTGGIQVKIIEFDMKKKVMH